MNARIANIPANDLMNVEPGYRNLPVAKGDALLTAVIKTSGTQALHPSGRRWFTYREQMRLQGFPDEHSLYGSTQEDFLTQIGNAVPANFMEIIFRQVIAALDETDTEVGAGRALVDVEHQGRSGGSTGLPVENGGTKQLGRKRLASLLQEATEPGTDRRFGDTARVRKFDSSVVILRQPMNPAKSDEEARLIHSSRRSRFGSLAPDDGTSTPATPTVRGSGANPAAWASVRERQSKKRRIFDVTASATDAVD